jgi:hypothetical protein
LCKADAVDLVFVVAVVIVMAGHGLIL